MAMREALGEFFSTNGNTIAVTSVVQTLFFAVDYISPSWFRECLMSASFLLSIITNKHTGLRMVVWIVAFATPFIIHAKRQLLCSYGALTVFAAANTFINTVAAPLTNYVVSDGLELSTVIALWEGIVKTVTSGIVGFLLICGTSLVLKLFKLVWTYPLQILLCIAIVYLVTWVVSSQPRLSNTLRSHMNAALLASVFFLVHTLVRVIPAFLGILLSPLRLYRYTEAVAIEKRRTSRGDAPLYAYRALGVSQIRLLRIRRRLPFTELQCQLIHVSLDEAPKYTAISYTWGDALPTHEVLIDGGRLPISSTVHDILHHQRSYFKEQTLWVDSMCINQSDNEEKAKQVVLMKNIFHRASGVVAWLGKTQHSFHTLTAIIGFFGKKQSPASTEELIPKVYSFMSDPEWTALSSLLVQPWFSRVWVVQEVAVAQNVRIAYGNLIIPWNALEELVEFLINDTFLFNRLELGKPSAYINSEERMSMRGAINANRMASMRKAFGKQQHTALRSVLGTCQHFKSSDPRDRVYALLGMTTDGSHENLFPDYDKPVEEVYIEATRFMLKQDGWSICMLLLAGMGYPRQLAALPTWVPDLSNDRPTPFTVRSAQIHKAGMSHTAIMMLFTDRAEALAVKGIILDQVEHIGPTFQPDEVPAPPTSVRMTAHDPKVIYIRNWFRETVSLVRSCARDPYPTGAPLDEVIWRTLIGDINVNGQNVQPSAPSHMADSFNDFKWFWGIDAEEPAGFVTAAAGNPTDEDALIRQIASATQFVGAFWSCMVGMRICITTEGSVAVMPPFTRRGDAVCVFWGASAPYLLRATEMERLHIEGMGEMDCYHLVGCCYVHGVMEGEIERVEEEEQWVFLV